jgi:hypothetical protein
MGAAVTVNSSTCFARMNHVVDILESALDEQELGVGHKRSETFIEVRIDDGVGDASLVFD